MNNDAQFHLNYSTIFFAASLILWALALIS